MKTLNKILILCKMSRCELYDGLDEGFSVYTSRRKLIIGGTDLNEALHCLRQYLNDPLKYFAKLI
mgnify:CR=1 FL=1